MSIQSLIFITSLLICLVVVLWGYLRIRRKQNILNNFYENEKIDKQEEVYKQTLADQIKLLLEKNNIKINFNKFVLVSLAAGIICAVIGMLLSGYLPIAITLLIVGCLAPYLKVKSLNTKREKEIAAEFSPMLKHLSNYLKAGNNLRQSLEKVEFMIEGPLKKVVSKIVRKIAGGMNINDAILEAYSEVPIIEFNMFIILVNIHNDMGGDLANSLDNLADVIYEKKQIRSEIDAITKETRTSAYITAALPIVLYSVMRAISPDYAEQIASIPMGNFLMFMCFVMVIIGAVLVKMISNVKVDKSYM